MDLAFTTLACPGWDLATICRQAIDAGYAAIDFRGYRGEMKLWELPEFSGGLAETAATIRDHGLAVTCVSSGIREVAIDPGERAAFDGELRATLRICEVLGAGQIRVFGGAFDEGDRSRDRATADLGANLRAHADLASEAGVDLLVETHDAWARSEDIVAAIAAADRPNVGVCWDVKHTYWLADETPLQTWRALGGLVRNTHWKDVRRGEDGRRDRLCPMGDGILPLRDAFQVLASAGYDGPWTLEWEKHWHPHIEEPEVAVPQFAEWMRATAEWYSATALADAESMGGG